MSAGGFLEKIHQLTLERVRKAKLEISAHELMQRQNIRKTLNFAEALKQKPAPRIIAEVKRRSPSLGDIASELRPVDIATAYVRGGAVAISVLTEPEYFGGCIQDLMDIRSACPDVPLLMKDFVLDKYQLLQGRAAGADAVLLMLSFLNESQFMELYAQARELGLTPLVEVHNEAEMQLALRNGVPVIGVNNRDLTTLKVDTKTSEILIKKGQAHAPVMISESGIESAEQIQKLMAHGYDAFLIGTQLTKRKTPEQDLKKLIEAAR